MYVVWGQVYPIMQWFAIGAFPLQYLNLFEKKSSTKVVKCKKIFFLNMRK
jgi:hypothetical protein